VCVCENVQYSNSVHARKPRFCAGVWDATGQLCVCVSVVAARPTETEESWK
jgi:hypothetical protein